MPLTLPEFNLLKKLMDLTTSPSDGEALAALRAANAILKKADVDWRKVFARTITVIDELSGRTVRQGEAPPELADAPSGSEAERLFEVALENARGGFRETIDDIYARYERSGRLSDAQWDVVRRAAG